MHIKSIVYSMTLGTLAGVGALILVQPSLAQTSGTVTVQDCANKKAWYLDQDFDGLGDPAHKIKRCLPREGYVRNNDDEQPTIAQFSYKGLQKGFVKITLPNKSYYKFRAFETFHAKKKVGVVRLEKAGTKRNIILTLHPRGRVLNMVDYNTGFATDSLTLVHQKYKQKKLLLTDFYSDDYPEVVVVLKTDSQVMVKLVKLRRGFDSDVATISLTDPTVVSKATTMTDNQIMLYDDTGTVVHTITVNEDYSVSGS